MRTIVVRVPFPAACVAIKRLFCVAKGGSAGCFDPTRSRAPTAIASLHQFAARRRTRRHGKRGASCRTTRTRSRRGRPSEYAVNLGGHDEVVLMQSLDLLGLQRDRRIAPTEADIRMMAFGLCEFTNLLNKGKRLAEIAKPEAPLDAVRQVLLARASVMLLAP